MRKCLDLVLVGFVMTLAACSDDPAGSPAPSPPGDGGTPPSGATANVWVYEIPPSGGAAAALAGAKVALDPADGGERVERDTDAEGRAVFDAKLFERGATVTAFARDHVIVSAFGAKPGKATALGGMEKGANDVVLELPLDEAGLRARTVLVKGSLLNKLASKNGVTINTNVLGTFFDGAAPTYEVRAPKGAPFFILGQEYEFTQPDARTRTAAPKRVFKIDRPAVDGDAQLDIDLATAPTIATETRRLKLVLPGGSTGPLGATGARTTFANVVDASGMFVPGVSSKVAPSLDGSAMDCEITLASVQPGAIPWVTRGVLGTADGALSFRQEEGALPDGATLEGFLVPPAVAVTTAKLSDPIPLSGIAAEVNEVRYGIAGDNGVVWLGLTNRSLGLPASVSVPPPPSGASLPATSTGQLIAIADASKIGGSFFLQRKGAFSAPFTVTK